MGRGSFAAEVVVTATPDHHFGMYARALRAAAAAAPLGSDERAELVEIALASSRDVGWRGRAAELGSLATFAVGAQVAAGTGRLRLDRFGVFAARGPGARAARAWVVGILVGVLYAVAVEVALAAVGSGGAGGEGLIAAAAWILVTGLIPVSALAVGRRRASMAIAVLVFWGWKLAASDAMAGLAALAAFDSGADEGELLLRWCLMASGVVLAAVAARRALRQARTI